MVFSGTVVATSVLTGSVVTKFYAEAQATNAQMPVQSINMTLQSNMSTMSTPIVASYNDSPLPDHVKIGIAATVCFIAGITQVDYTAYKTGAL